MTPESLADSIGHVRALRVLIEQIPQAVTHLKPLLYEHYAKRGIQLPTISVGAPRWYRISRIIVLDHRLYRGADEENLVVGVE